MRNSQGQLIVPADAADDIDSEVIDETLGSLAPNRLDVTERYKILFMGRLYPIVDFQAAEPEVGIQTGFFIFCPINAPEEGYTCDLGEEGKNIVNVYNHKGKKLKEKAEIIKIK